MFKKAIRGFAILLCGFILFGCSMLENAGAPTQYPIAPYTLYFDSMGGMKLIQLK